MRYLQYNITDKEGVLKYLKDWKRELPEYASFDDETDGLNIKHNNPFLMAFGFVTNDLQTIYTYTLDLELAPKQVIIDTYYIMKKMFKYATKVIGHHITFDLHMQRNIGLPFDNWDKFTDTQIYIRLGHDAKIPKEGGAPLKLKEYAARFIDPRAKLFEEKLKNEITAKKREATIKLKMALKGHALPPKYNGTAKSWTMKVVEQFVKDKLNELKDLPSETAYVIKNWVDSTPDPSNYRLLNRENVTEYAHYDVIYTLLIFLKLKDVIVERGQQKTLEREERAIRGLYELEANGFHFDYENGILAKEKMRNYILALRDELNVLAGTNVRVGQHKILKNILFFRYGLNFANTDKSTLELVFTMEDVDPNAVRMIEIIGELRSLEKWYSTYLVKWIHEVEVYGSVVYPTYHQCGTVTGRVSSAFQQFPKKGKYTIDNEFLFHPRELFKPPPGKKLIFFDYSAMEMRLLAIYTILIGKPDINLVRAFQPYECYRLSVVNDRYSFQNDEPNWEQFTWYKNEDDTIWKPTDIHAMTARKAFDVDESHPEFKTYYRPHGKTTNFAIVYGATAKTISKNQKLPMSIAQRLYNAYFETYPGVKAYNEYIRRHVDHYGYVTNLFDRKYYGCNAHKGKNYPIQGSGADYTKDLIPDISDLIRETDITMQMYLHDEFAFAAPLDISDEEINEIKTMMERLNSPITMVVDVEETTTNWKEKDDYAFKSA